MGNSTSNFDLRIGDKDPGRAPGLSSEACLGSAETNGEDPHTRRAALACAAASCSCFFPIEGLYVVVSRKSNIV